MVVVVHWLTRFPVGVGLLWADSVKGIANECQQLIIFKSTFNTANAFYFRCRVLFLAFFFLFSFLGCVECAFLLHFLAEVVPGVGFDPAEIGSDPGTHAGVLGSARDAIIDDADGVDGSAGWVSVEQWTTGIILATVLSGSISTELAVLNRIHTRQLTATGC